MKRYRYIAAVLVRPAGAIGTFDAVQFPVILADATATAGQVFDKWQELAGEDFESNGIRIINGEETMGVGVDYQFQGEEVTT
jgi:hypothetical protein